MFTLDCRHVKSSVVLENFYGGSYGTLLGLFFFPYPRHYTQWSILFCRDLQLNYQKHHSLMILHFQKKLVNRILACMGKIVVPNWWPDIQMKNLSTGCVSLLPPYYSNRQRLWHHLSYTLLLMYNEMYLPRILGQRERKAMETSLYN